MAVKTGEYFEIKVQDGSVEGLEKRIKDNELRGFVEVRRYEFTSGTGKWSQQADQGWYANTYKQQGGTSRMTYGAVMRRPNRDLS